MQASDLLSRIRQVVYTRMPSVPHCRALHAVLAPPIAIQLVIRQDLRCDNMCLDVRKIEGILPHFTCSFCLTCMCDVGL